MDTSLDARALGPIGHLPVDEDAARDAAAGPRVTVPPAWARSIRPWPAPQPVQAMRAVQPPTFSRLAACRGMDTAMFFPHRGADCSAPKAVCARCDVRDECLEFALQNGERHGIWGGTSERERRRMRRERREVAA